MNKKLTLHSGPETLEKLGVTRRQFAPSPRFDIAPGQLLGAVVNENGERVFRGFCWGLVPFWWNDEQRETQRLFAARSETLTNRPSFSAALRHRRAVVPVDGFWMWREIEGEKRPFYFRAKNGEPLFLAAIWDNGNAAGDGENRLALVSVEANRLVEPLGARMPAVLRGADADLWLDSEINNERVLLKALQTLPARFLGVVATAASASGWQSLEAAPDARDILALTYGSAFKVEKPRFAPRARKVRRDHAAGGHVFFRTRSFTRDDATRWHPTIDLENGAVFCDCPDFRFRHALHEPDVWTPHWWCKHLCRAVDNCKRHGELPARLAV
ncbi:Putative SOS response-associated peptidase YedK [Abditibacterium utsteinense]|uniref:Abasic site processing protein n=1 Tax=Abditibacterium utsteinense TaxID=1960156 RepID=A0A2S8SNX0_9BACT|nr:SOS response-associated peptidase [Abditibacterium utsteinense]PQV62492.1 Putative SOS response-associated peptidase YedK [Abditibacterium utsteinense]